MRALVYLLTVFFLLALTSGCGNDKDRGVNRHKDLPRSAPPENGK
jgi:hypothetical protein